MESEVKEKIRDIYTIVEEIKQFPQTYHTILKECKSDGTCQNIVRRKLNSLCKQGLICKTRIPGTRFGQAIFYTHNKNYYILVEGVRVGCNVYCFFGFKKIGKHYLRMIDSWRLHKHTWVRDGESIVFDGDVLMFI